MSLFLFFSCQSESTHKTFNDPPKVTIVSHSDGASFFEGEEVLFFAQLSDSNHQNEDLQATWSVDDIEICSAQSPNSEGISQCSIEITEQATEISVRVTDTQQAAARDAIVIDVQQNQAPIVTILSPQSEQLYFEGDS